MSLFELFDSIGLNEKCFTEDKELLADYQRVVKLTYQARDEAKAFIESVKTAKITDKQRKIFLDKFEPILEELENS